MRARIAVLTVALTIVAAPTARAGWLAPEPVGMDISQVLLAPGAVGWVTGFYATAPSRARFRLRPLEGTLGPLNEFPGTSGTVTELDPTVWFDAAGNAIIANEATRHVAYRSADGLTTTDEVLSADAQNRPKLVSVDPVSGAALIGIQGSTPTGIIRVLFREPGPGASPNTNQVDEANAVTFDTASQLIGLQLQPDGGAIVVWRKGDALLQAVRPAGQAAFGAPSEIGTPGDPRKQTVMFDSDPSGWAMLTWYGSTTAGPTRSDRALATVRAPNGSFPPAQEVGTSPVAGGVVNVAPTITSKGAGLVTWRHVSAGDCSPTTVMGVRYENGGFTQPAPLAGAAYPNTAIAAGLPVSAGDRIAVPIARVTDVAGTPCGFGDDTRDLVVRHFTGTAGGLTDDGTSELAPVERRADGTPKSPVVNQATIDPSGRMLVWYQTDGTERFLRAFDGVVPAAPGGGGGGTTAPPPAPPAPPAVIPPSPGPAPTPIKPLRLQEFVRVRAIDPAALEVPFTCVAEPRELCAVDYAVYYAFTGRVPSPSGGTRKPTAAAAAKKRTIVLARGKGRAGGGKSVKVALKPTKLGKRFLRLGRKLKITLEARVTVTDGRKATKRFTTTIKAPKRRAPRRG